MTEPLGLSIGTTNLVAARVGRPPVTRRSVLTIPAGRPPEVGAAAQNSSADGIVLTGFVDRVGDPVPIVAADGTSHRGEQVLAAALAAMARLVDGGSPVTVAVPAHWGPGTVGALRGALRNVPSLSPDGVPPTLVPDSSAALSSLRTSPGLPGSGVVVLVDLGAGGSSVTLANAGADLSPIGQTVRHHEFSGDGIDRALLDHVLAGVSEADAADTSGTAAVGPLTRLRDECRAAKERLSAETATAVPVDVPGYRSDVRVTRPELEQLIASPLDGLLATIDDTLQRNGVATENISAVATVGGGAAIPLVTQRLSERLRAPVITTPQSGLNIAAGAALLANVSLDADAPTGMAPTGMAAAADVPTAMGPAVDAPTALGPAAGPVAGGALAWSQDDDAAADPTPYTGADYTASAAYGDPGSTAARPPVAFGPDGFAPGEDDRDDLAPLPWYKRPPLLFGVAAAAALLAVGGLAVTLTSSDGESTTVTETASTTPPEGSTPVELPPPVTTVTVGPDGVATTTVSQPPPPPPSSTTTTTAPSSSTTTTTVTTTTTAPTTTTTAPTTTTTRPTTTRPTTTQPPTTTQAPPPTTAEPAPTVDPPEPIVTTVIPDDGA